MACLQFWEKKEGFCQRGRGRSFHVVGPKTVKGAGTNSGECGVRNLEAESIRRGAESTGGCANWKMVTEIRQSSTHDTFIAESVGGCVKLKTDAEIRQSSARDTIIAESVYFVLKKNKKNCTSLPKQKRQCLFAFQVFES